MSMIVTLTVKVTKLDNKQMNVVTFRKVYSPFRLRHRSIQLLLMKRDVTSGLPFAYVWSYVCMHVNGKLIHV